MLVISIVIVVLYLLLIGSFVFGFDKVPNMNLEDMSSNTAFTIIIPFRNEAHALPNLLNSLVNLNYSTQQFEVIFVDDQSEDSSVETIKNHLSRSPINFSILQNELDTDAPKKTAITKGISNSKYEWIVTTDADCSLPRYWLDAIDFCIQKNKSQFVVAPVTYQSPRSFLDRFQLLDFLSLQGTTIGSFGINKPLLCNGANLAYSKSLFKTLNGFDGNDHISSGDDIFLLQKATKTYPKDIHYLKHEHAIVQTMAESNFKKLISQRVRWASKSSSYTSLFAKLTGIIVFLMNGYLVCGPLLVLANFMALKHMIYIFVIKSAIDFLLLFKTTRFFNQETVLSTYFLACLIHPFFTVYIVFISVFRGYKWKGRSYN